MASDGERENAGGQDQGIKGGELYGIPEHVVVDRHGRPIMTVWRNLHVLERRTPRGRSKSSSQPQTGK